MKISWNGFSKKSYQERLELLKAQALLSPERQASLEKDEQMSVTVADQLSENVVGTFSLPYSLVPEVLVNGQEYTVPYVTEEPSVVAAASYASKIIKRAGGFTAQVHQRQMIGQVALYQVANPKLAQEKIASKKAELLELANQAYPSIVKRGGGARDLHVEQIKGEPDFLVVYIHVDTQEAMGANMLNTMLEALKPVLEELSQGQSLMGILSNYATDSLVTASCRMAFRYLSRQKDQGREIAEKIALASQFAQDDPYRAATHNKGIFNGIDAILIATGNDWRAIEAGAHAFASRDGRYQGLSCWTLDLEREELVGEMTLPMPVATKGGSIGLNPRVALSHDLLGNPSARELAQIIVSIGLAQNFAALKALVSTGIQQGHMKLQAKSLALLAGASESEVAPLVEQLIADKTFNLETAQRYLENLRLFVNCSGLKKS
ncbi:3-hydroxy-3-methylglutaryl-coenzyme a reductase [Streptococcus pneumoniae]|uniref:hydroxymethylglutaryl-CoA reductase, degradative n=1 Tax=Streptococcus pneumoniae TaxID=1313 RepID=UPI000B58B7CF|nr:hydroxymethylglutaryl-CoA reductase, degradative [Streptococcus pneumoniae]MDD0785600.1 hydroxymethylglutaryl-CoA reductase, degradative [Streptococcus pneumoniae]MDS3618586.1 hydroxymethylglutaryl-CoA reductase, degradative [Streptococcus pneumoniae]MDS3846506.1 hydroxymethylglutaryl-CoA reductase, degradative [Streptococcus pneumoniae]MDS5609384.1 hydroxymethylglutaryl-CoA reductase, degradative [Streptococcus pneumoniae]MDS5748350.1 hydroxymethylglutaryl-CoA reductase, degradative [Strep